ncbi:MAG TPA: hypothetical protein VLP30_07960, partial [Desulfatirhabdiaceae bacterium]|nr:hypothetical protein [Desulfatirhabdiaceae bacterium]
MTKNILRLGKVIDAGFSSGYRIEIGVADLQHNLPPMQLAGVKRCLDSQSDLFQFHSDLFLISQELCKG